MKNKKLIASLATVALVGGTLFASLAGMASAQTLPSGTAATATVSSTRAKGSNNHGVAGTIVSINGNTITLTGKNGTTYMIDASAATISQITTINVSGLSVGNTIMVGGTVNGTSVTAKSIMSGTLPTRSFAGRSAGAKGNSSKGSGVTGTVSAINGTSLSVTGKNGTAYSVNVANAKVMKGTSGSAPAVSTVSAITVGDSVSIRGTISGTSVTATSVFDGIHQARAPSISSTTTQ